MFVLFGICLSPLLAIDLREAAIVAPKVGIEAKAAQMLTEEIAKRTQIRLPIVSSAPANVAAIELKTVGSAGADGYRVKVTGKRVVVNGNDPRGTLFGAGYLLRHLRMERQILEVADDLQISTAPRYPLRGHQLGYRPKVNAYDGWTPAQFEQYIRDLVVFGTNAVELIPPRSDDNDDSPHFSFAEDRDDGRGFAYLQ
jgi:hypothetical protein